MLALSTKRSADSSASRPREEARTHAATSTPPCSTLRGSPGMRLPLKSLPAPSMKSVEGEIRVRVGERDRSRPSMGSLAMPSSTPLRLDLPALRKKLRPGLPGISNGTSSSFTSMSNTASDVAIALAERALDADLAVRRELRIECGVERRRRSGSRAPSWSASRTRWRRWRRD